MIIGNGLIAKSLHHLKGWEKDLIFASGVSNSGSDAPEFFQRETNLVLSHLKKLQESSLFVYFSTISIHDTSPHNKNYKNHKKFIEEIIRSETDNYLIIRLPNMVGKSPNPNTLINFFVQKIKENKMIQLQKNAVRHLIDAEDLPAIMEEIKKNYNQNKLTIDIETSAPVHVKDIIFLLEKTLNRKAIVQETQNETAFLTDRTSADEILTWKTGPEYLLEVFKKYYSH